MIKAATESGFSFTLTDEALDDWELIEALSEVDEGNPQMIVKCTKKLLGVDQYNAAKEHLRDKNGHVSLVAMTQLVQEVFGAVGDNNAVKNG